MAAKETACVGPPGTGKTTWIAKQVELASQKFDPESIYVMSFTKAAAKELVDRDLKIPKGNATTIHSRAYRLLGTPLMAEARISKFNEDRAPQFQLSNKAAADEDFDAYATPGDRTSEADRMFSQVQIERARMTPMEAWPLDVRTWYETEWEPFKRDNDLRDFSDLLEDARMVTRGGDFDPPPEVLIVDEAQDCSPLELALVRNWAVHASHLVMAGDPDQSIYYFKGAEPNGMFEFSIQAESYVRTLKKSFRVPRRVHAFARRWILTLQDRRVDAEYEPRDEEGELVYETTTWKDPEPICRQAMEQAAAGESVMILTSCSYQLEPVRRALRAAAFPFANPYREKRTDWNPLCGNLRGVSAADRIWYLSSNDQFTHGAESRFWTWKELRELIAPLGKAMFPHGSKTALQKLCDQKIEHEERDPYPIDIAHYFHPTAFDKLIEGNVDEYYLSLQPSLRTRYQYPIEVAKRYGFRALKERPRLIIGTIHSVKGAQADNVYVFPDISTAAHDADTQEAADAIVRTYYVAATRALRRLIVCRGCEDYVAEGFTEMAREVRQEVLS